jgi:pimeloyl-ACP methyl ester carboxylesterase
MGRPRFRKLYLFSLVALACGALAAMAYPTAHLHLRAASLLLRIEHAKSDTAIAGYDTHPIDETLITIQAPGGKAPARLYVPRGIANAPRMVVVHGVHHLGIEEPRLVNFSRALAAGGIEVLTPELRSLADYQVHERDIAVIGAAAQALHQRAGAKVGVLGLSFAGGLSLLAAADPQFADDIGFVVAIGAHDDLERVCRYLATGQTSGPDGAMQSLPAHEYGALVLVYSHIDDFFSPTDSAVAREALRLQLWEQVDAARARAEQLSPAGRATMQLLLQHKQDALAPELLRRLPLHTAEMARVSPHGHLAALRVPVLLLHGTGDSVIPATETLWLASQIPPQHLRSVLISPLITHVEVGGAPSWREKTALVEFIAAMLKETDRLRTQ